jgi:type I restriction enzyme S subunit
VNFDDLPDSWELVKLGEIFEFNYGKSLVKSTRSEGEYFVYGSNGVIGSHLEYLVNQPCLIIGRKGSIGEIHYSENPCWPIDTTYYINKFYDQPVKYWFYQLKFLNLVKLDRATAIPGLNRNDSYEIQIPLPPLNEQKRIVEKIELIQERTKIVKSELDNIKVKLKQFRRSLLASAFRGDLTKDWRADHPDIESATVLLGRIKKERREKWEQAELEKMRAKGITPKDDKWKSKYSEPHSLKNIDDLPSIPDGWCWGTFEEVFDIYVGATPSRKRPDFWNGEIAWVSSGEISFCDIYKTKETITELGLKNTSTQLHPPNTVLLGMIGEGKTRGQVAILKISACNNQNSAAIRVPEHRILSKYVYFYLESEYQKTRQLGAGNNQVALNKRLVQTMLMLFPSTQEQEEIVKKLEKMMKFADQVEEQVKEAEKKLEKFNQSVLAKAFRGKLVPQDPNDEPASVLLGKIQQEKNSTTVKKIKK